MGTVDKAPETLSEKARAIAWYGDEVVGMQTPDQRFTWITFPLIAAFESPARDQILLSLIRSWGLTEPVKSWEDKIIVQFARSRQGGWLLFLFNLQPQVARVELEPTWKFSAAQDLLEKSSLAVPQGHLLAEVPAHAVKVIHLN